MTFWCKLLQHFTTLTLLVQRSSAALFKFRSLAGNFTREMPRQLPPTEIKLTTMDEALQKKAIAIAEDAAQSSPTKKDMAAKIKKAFDRLGKGTFHCIVGRDFGSFVTHEPGGFIFMYVDAYAVLVFRGKVQPPFTQQEQE